MNRSRFGPVAVNGGLVRWESKTPAVQRQDADKTTADADALAAWVRAKLAEFEAERLRTSPLVLGAKAMAARSK